MKRLNFNIKDRKVLTLGLCLILVCVFTLTVAYAALSAVLTIQGSAQVTSGDWDIHLANPKVTNGSATTNVPQIKTNSTMDFSTTLNMPGDFYEFTVDVVNSGSIDAMIENVVKTPDLTVEQAKFLKYEITYQNNEPITTKQLLSKDTTMPIKVRIEYRKDLNNTDLPTSQIVLDLTLTLEYVQSDGTGTSVKDNGVYKPVSANGDINEIGTIVTIGDQQFYTIGTDGDNVKLLSMYNLYVGNKCATTGSFSPLENPTGKQSESAKGWFLGFTEDNPIIGATEYSNTTQKGANFGDYTGSLVEKYVNDYKTILEYDYGVDVVEARILSYDELTDSETFACSSSSKCSDNYSWIYSTSYWLETRVNPVTIWAIYSSGEMNNAIYGSLTSYGVRPVIIISKSNF